jgi:hypothetical protein
MTDEIKADTWNIRTLADAYRERPPVQYVLEGVFSLPSVSSVYSAPGALKSYFLADLAVCVAVGLDFLPPAPWQSGGMGIKTLQVPVFWLDVDNGVRETDDRFEALARARDLPEDIPLYYVSMPNPPFNASNKTDIDALALRIINCCAKLVIIDNLGTISGGADENSGQMISVMGGLRRLSEITGAAVVVIHHQRKPNGNTVRAGDSLRGHSSIEAALDLALIIEREEGSDTITLKSTKTRGKNVYPFSAAFTYELDENEDLKTARFYGLPADDDKSDRAIEREILDNLSSNEMNQTALAQATQKALPSVSNKRIRDRIKFLEGKKTIICMKGSHNASFYRLPQSSF